MFTWAHLWLIIHSPIYLHFIQYYCSLYSKFPLSSFPITIVPCSLSQGCHRTACFMPCFPIVVNLVIVLILLLLSSSITTSTGHFCIYSHCTILVPHLDLFVVGTSICLKFWNSALLYLSSSQTSLWHFLALLILFRCVSSFIISVADNCSGFSKMVLFSLDLCFGYTSDRLVKASGLAPRHPGL